MKPIPTDMSPRAERTGEDRLPFFKADDGAFWLGQNAAKRSRWAVLAKSGDDVAWEFGKNRSYTGRMLIDGENLTASEATKKRFKSGG